MTQIKDMGHVEHFEHFQQTTLAPGSDKTPDHA